MNVGAVARLLVASFLSLTLGSCAIHRPDIRGGTGMGDTHMPAARDQEKTRRLIERELARESAGKPAPFAYESWQDYWTDCLWHWHYTERDGDRWLGYTAHRREQLHLPAIWNWT